MKTEGICTEEEISGKIEVNEPSNCDIALSDNESQNLLAPSAYQQQVEAELRLNQNDAMSQMSKVSIQSASKSVALKQQKFVFNRQTQENEHTEDAISQ